MAGTLITQNIQGPSTGANANKILVPSGQTLDVSGGTLTPSAGAMVQMVHQTFSGVTSYSTSTSYIDTGMEITITPEYSDSKILVILTTQVGVQATSTVTQGLYRQSRMDFRLVDSSASTVLFAANYAGSDANEEGNLSVITHAHGIYTATSTSSLTFKAQARPANGNAAEAGAIFHRFYGGGSTHTITAMEIKQ